MFKVTYDGELVEFQGTVPQDLQGLLNLMQHTANSQGKILLSVKVDGHEALSGEVDLGSKSFNQVDVQSGSEKQLFLKAIDVTLSHTPDADVAIDPILESLLSDTWANAFNKLNNFVQGLASYLELLSNLSQYAKNNRVSWRDELQKNMKALEDNFTKLLRMCETQQVAELTSLLNFDFRPVYTDSLALTKGAIRQTFAN